jgi:general stress protein CsbA
MLSWYVAQVLSGIIIAAAAAALYVHPYSYIVTLELSIKISQYIKSNTQT